MNREPTGDPREERGGGSVAVVIVDWNAGDLLARALACLGGQTVRPRSVIVVDNAGAVPSARHAGAYGAPISVLRLDRNRGFAAAANEGIARTPEVDWVALLNPDAFPEPTWLEQLLRAAERNPDYSFFASRQLMAEEPGRLDGTGDEYSAGGLAWRRHHGEPAEARGLRAEEVFGSCAAAALYRRDAVVEVGGLDDSFFCYFEDVDLAFRLRLAGHRCLYVPEAVVHHVGSATSGRGSDFSVYHGHRNRVWTFVKNMPGPLLALYWPHHLLVNLAGLLWFTLRGQARAIWRAKWDAAVGLPRVLRQRRAVQLQRRVGSAQIRRMMARGWRAFGLGRRVAR